jgi:hypothetical protein
MNSWLSIEAWKPSPKARPSGAHEQGLQEKDGFRKQSLWIPMSRKELPDLERRQAC